MNGEKNTKINNKKISDEEIIKMYRDNQVPNDMPDNIILDYYRAGFKTPDDATVAYSYYQCEFTGDLIEYAAKYLKAGFRTWDDVTAAEVYVEGGFKSEEFIAWVRNYDKYFVDETSDAFKYANHFQQDAKRAHEYYGYFRQLKNIIKGVDVDELAFEYDNFFKDDAEAAFEYCKYFYDYKQDFDNIVEISFKYKEIFGENYTNAREYFCIFKNNIDIAELYNKYYNAEYSKFIWRTFKIKTEKSLKLLKETMKDKIPLDDWESGFVTSCKIWCGVDRDKEFDVEINYDQLSKAVKLCKDKDGWSYCLAHMDVIEIFRKAGMSGHNANDYITNGFRTMEKAKLAVDFHKSLDNSDLNYRHYGSEAELAHIFYKAGFTTSDSMMSAIYYLMFSSGNPDICAIVFDTSPSGLKNAKCFYDLGFKTENEVEFVCEFLEMIDKKGKINTVDQDLINNAKKACELGAPLEVAVDLACVKGDYSKVKPFIDSGISINKIVELIKQNADFDSLINFVKNKFSIDVAEYLIARKTSLKDALKLTEKWINARIKIEEAKKVFEADGACEPISGAWSTCWIMDAPLTPDIPEWCVRRNISPHMACKVAKGSAKGRYLCNLFIARFLIVPPKSILSKNDKFKKSEINKNDENKECTKAKTIYDLIAKKLPDIADWKQCQQYQMPNDYYSKAQILRNTLEKTSIGSSFVNDYWEKGKTLKSIKKQFEKRHVMLRDFETALNSIE